METDVLIIGAGHNGLTCAGYLARAGLSVHVLERRKIVGGASVTEEFHPGFRNSTCAYGVSMLNPKVIDDLELKRYGLDIIERSSGALVLGQDNNYLYGGSDFSEFLKDIGRHSQQDAERYEEFCILIQDIADVLRDMVLKTPPNIGGGLGDLWRAGLLANQMRKLSPKLQHEIIKIFTMSIADYLAEWFEGDLLTALESYMSQVGNFQSVYSGGTAYALLHHAFGEINGKKGMWGLVRGGMGGITQAMAKSAIEHGAQIEVGQAVKQVLVENGKATGVVTEDGKPWRARAVSANVNPKLLFQRLVPTEHLSDDFIRKINNYRCGSGAFRMNVAMSELPRFSCLAEQDNYEQFLGGSIFITSSLRYNNLAWQEAINDGWSSKPIIQMVIPSIYDDSLAPPGKHVASLFCQHFNPNLPDGRNWDDVKDEVTELILDTVNELAPGFRNSLLGSMSLSPLDLEREFGLIGGDIFHGGIQTDQLFSLRPVAGYADYRMPIKNLYLCGSGAHPGGGVTGCPGHNTAREILKDIN